MEKIIANRPWFRIAVLLLAGCFILVLEWFAGHGNFDFRAHMAEDWITFGLAAFCFMAAIVIFLKAVSKKSA